jgi:tRNA 2-selenouridine synthase
LIQKITIEQFLEMPRQYPVLDVRSPGEYLHAHIPGAYNLPLFTDEERKVVGTAYKQQSRQAAIKIGLDYFGLKMRKMVEETEVLMVEYKSINSLQHASSPPLGDGSVLIHCWRGGMRSAGVAWLLDLYGFKIYTLTGGYKVYRKWVRAQFEKKYDLTVLGGYTGSGKTEVLKQLQKEGMSIVDLEGLAHHKGSAFGALGQPKQPTQEMFENLLAQELGSSERSLKETFFIEDESQRIGLLKIPDPFWATMRKSAICFLEIPFEERLDYLTAEYGKYEKEKLVNAVIRIQKRLGGLETKNAVGYLVEDNYKEGFRILLKYYDRWYKKGLHNRDGVNELLTTIGCDKIEVNTITGLIIEQQKKYKHLLNI